jgi:cytochrome c-type biogenesis protein CcsB
MTDIVLDESLSQLSLLIVFASMALLTLSLLFFSLDLARQIAPAGNNKQARRNFWLISARIALLLTSIVLGVAVVLRGIAAQRVPWANMYEFSISGAFVLLVSYQIANLIRDLRSIATLITGFALLVLGSAVTLFYVEVKTLMPALQSYWLVIHVVVAILATAFFNIAGALHTVYLLKTSKRAQQDGTYAKVMATFPASETLDRYAYRLNILGFILWTFTLIAGAIWAERAWHRYWGWDTKEVWTFIIWVVYAGYLHAKATRGWDARRAAWLGLIGFGAVVFNFTIVNLFFKGLHVYSGL